MKRKFLAVLLVAVTVLSVTACGNSGGSDDTKKEATKAEDTTEKKDEQKETKVDSINLDCAEGTLAFKRAEKTTDFEGNPALLAYFDYTNKKEETAYSQLTFYVQSFQNGVECEMGISSATDNEAYNNATKEIQTGTTLEVAFMFTLSDDTSPITLKVTDQSADNIMNNIYQEQEIVL